MGTIEQMNGVIEHRYFSFSIMLAPWFHQIKRVRAFQDESCYFLSISSSSICLTSSLGILKNSARLFN
jgi:hypothetical protein